MEDSGEVSEVRRSVTEDAQADHRFHSEVFLDQEEEKEASGSHAEGGDSTP